MQELIQDYHKNQGSPRCAQKIELMKAYDSIKWGFLFEVLKTMEFPPQFLKWTKACVSTAMFSISINGELVDYFPGKRGLRQGDPLFPTYSFYLWRIFLPSCRKESVKVYFLIILGAGPHISHLIFADVFFIMCGADPLSFQIINGMLQDFHSMCGLKPNLQKSCVHFAGASAEIKGVLQHILAIPDGMLPVQYLGVPHITTRLHALDC